MEKQGFDLPKVIGEHIVVITLLIVWLAIFLCTISHVPFGEMEAHQTVSYVLTIIAMLIFVAAFPATAVLFGWFTKRKVGALLLGALLLPAIYLLFSLFLFHGNMVFLRVPETAIYLIMLSVISGLAGYYAAHRNERHLALSIVLAGLWVFAFMSGIN